MPVAAPPGPTHPDPRGSADAGRMKPQQTEDERDVEIAEQRLREIESDPGTVLRGTELDDFMKSIL